MAKRTPVTSFSSTVNADEYKAKLAVNDCIQDLSNLMRIKARLVEFTFATVASTRTYVLPKRVRYPLYSMRNKTEDIEILPIDTHEFEFNEPDDDDSGSPEMYYLDEATGVSNQPAAAGEVIYAVSDSGSDSGTVVVQGYNVAGDYVADEITLSGTTAVASSSTFVKIESISKIATTGTITFRNLGSTTTYLTLSPKETHRRSMVIGLHPIPSAVETIYCKGHLSMPSMVNEYDVPVGLAEEHINAIMAGSLYHYMKYDPAFKREGLDGFKSDFYDEVKKIIGIDYKDRIPHRMRSPYEARLRRVIPQLNKI
jgi:hypothetical protein